MATGPANLSSGLPLIAAAYIRVSTEDQTEYSPEAQLKALRRYAAQNNMVLDDRYIFSDEGISGRKAEKRPGFMSMIAHAKSREHPFDVILVHKFDRFARSREDSVVYKSMLRRECNVRVISITESIEDDKFSVILEAMLEAMAEYYSINLSDEVKKGMTEKAARGGLQSSPSFGYRAQQNRLVPVPEEAAVVRQLFERFVAGAGYLDLAKWANSQGVRTHRGNLFENRTVEYLLQNPVYIGSLRWTPTGRARRDYHHPDTITVSGQHEPLISQELWEQAQKKALLLKASTPHRARSAQGKKHWLCGLVRCAACGSTLVAYPDRKSGQLYFKCLGYTHGTCTSQQHIRVDLLEASFLSRLQDDTLPSSGLQFTTVRAPSAENARLADLQHQLDLTSRKISRLREAFLAGAESVEDYAAAKRSLEARLADLRRQLEAQSPPPPEDPQLLLRRAILSTLQTLRSPHSSTEEKFSAASTLLSSCTFNRKPDPTLSITYRLTI